MKKILLLVFLFHLGFVSFSQVAVQVRYPGDSLSQIKSIDQYKIKALREIEFERIELSEQIMKLTAHSIKQLDSLNKESLMSAAEHEDIMQANITETIINVIASFIFLVIIFILFRPWFLIGNKICKIDNGYKFKIINITPFFKCTDFKISLRKVIVKDLIKGTDLKFEMLEQKDNPFIYIPNILSGFKESKPNCLQSYTEKKVEEIIESDGTYIELIITSKHGLTGLQSTRRKKYRHLDCVKQGKFKSGHSFKIV